MIYVTFIFLAILTLEHRYFKYNTYVEFGSIMHLFNFNWPNTEKFGQIPNETKFFCPFFRTFGHDGRLTS